MDISDLSTFRRAYETCALWSSYETVDEGTDEEAQVHLDEHPGSLTPEAIDRMREDCAAFINANAADLADLDASQCGHDFWLTRNGHGAGFWDRGYGALGERLTEACKAFKEVDLYVGDDGQIHHSP